MPAAFAVRRWTWGALGAVLCLGAPAWVAAQAVPRLPSRPPTPKAAPRAPEAPAAQPALPAPGVPAAPAEAGAPPRRAAGERDPFDPLVVKPAPGQERVQQLAGLKLVGVVWDPANRAEIRALVETPDGLGYSVRLNEEKFGGRVVGIEPDRVRFSVREQVPGGPSRVRTVELKLGGQ